MDARAENTDEVPGAEAAEGVSWERVFLFGAGALASTILLKIAQVQFLELLYVAQIALLAVAFSRNGFRTVVYGPLLWLGLLYGGFCVAAVALGVASLRFDFYLPAGLSAVAHPVVVSLARTFELVLDAFGLLYLAGLFRRSDDKLRFTMKVYFWTGFASALYGVLSVPVLRVGLGEFGAIGLGRVRGFYNEGGPYGMYAVTLFYVGIALYRRGWEPKGRVWAAMGVIALALVLSVSKAAFAMLLVMVLLNALLAQGVGKRLTILGLGAMVVIGVFSNANIGRQLRMYQEQGERYEQLSQRHAKDVNFVQGRVAGVFIVPRMIVAHPWTGVGWGNYGIVRNDPQYRGASAWADLNDEPGLGLPSLAAELGLPLTGVLMLCMALPYFYARRAKAPDFVANLALVQPMVHTFGAQLNLTYPWIVTSFALGLAFYYGRSAVTGTNPVLNEDSLHGTGMAPEENGFHPAAGLEGSESYG